MRWSIRTWMVLSYVGMALLIVAGLAAGAAFFIETGFRSFVEERIVRESRATVAAFGAVLAEPDWLEHGPGHSGDFAVLGMEALEKGLITRLEVEGVGGPVGGAAPGGVVGEGGAAGSAAPGGLMGAGAQGGTVVLWDTRTHNGGLCDAMLTAMERTMSQRVREGAYHETAFPLPELPGGVKVRLWVGYWGPYYFNEAESYFLESLYGMLGAGTLVVLVIAVMLGLVLAGRMADPILALAAAAPGLGREEGRGRDLPRLEGLVPREVAALRDALDELRKDLEVQQALRARLSADISHELRTPLTSLRGSLEAFADGVWTPEPKRLQFCADQVGRLTGLVERIEDLGRLDAGERQPRLEETDLAELIRAVVAGFGREAAARGFVVDEDLGLPGQLVMRTDRAMAEGIVGNLVGNALKYCPDGARVRVRALGTTSVVVEDNGPGIPADERERVFERLYRLEGSRSRDRGGEGLGLAIARSMARQLGGELVCRESDLGGAAFVWTLGGGAGASA